MNVGELFLNLGIKGTEKTVAALDGARKGLKEISSVSFEAKAAIVGVMYALERMMAASSQRGTDLMNFNAAVGVSMESLQRYQYAAQQVGVSNQSVEGTFKSLQSSMTKMFSNGEAPQGMARVAQVIGAKNGEIAQLALEATRGHPEKLFQVLQEYAQKEKNLGLGNQSLESFGLGMDMIGAMRRNAFRPDIMAKAPVSSDSELKSLDQIHAKWANLGTKIEMAFSHFNAKHGNEIVNNISKIVDKVVVLAEAFERLSEKLHVFELMGKVFEGWSIILDAVADSVDSINDVDGGKGSKGGAPKLDVNGKPLDKVPGASGTMDSVALDALMNLPTIFKGLTDEMFGEKPSTFGVVPKNAWTVEPPSAGGKIVAPKSDLPPGIPRRLKRDKTKGYTAPKPETKLQSSNPQFLPNSQWQPKVGGAAPTVKLAPKPSPLAPQTKAITPPMPAQAAGGGNVQNVTVTQTLNFQDAKDAKKNADSVKKAVKDAFLTNPALSGGF